MRLIFNGIISYGVPGAIPACSWGKGNRGRSPSPGRANTGAFIRKFNISFALDGEDIYTLTNAMQLVRKKGEPICSVYSNTKEVYFVMCMVVSLQTHQTLTMGNSKKIKINLVDYNVHTTKSNTKDVYI